MAAICTAIQSRRLHQAKLLVQMGVDVNARNSAKRTALMELCFLEGEDQNAAKLARILLDNGARVGIRDADGMTALCYAAKLGREHVVSAMMDETHSFDPNAADKLGNTALHYSAMSGNFVVLDLLLRELKKLNLNIDKVNLKGETPLICASKAGNFLCSRILISGGNTSTQARDTVEFKTAGEWEKSEDQRSATESPLYKTQQRPRRISSGVPEKHSSPTALVIRWPQTAPDKLESFGEKGAKSHRENLTQLYQLYEGQLSNAFRPSVKPRPKPVESPTDSFADEFDMLGTCDLYSSTGTSSPSTCSLTRRFSVSKAAKLAANTTKFLGRRSVAVGRGTNTKPSMSRRMSTTRPSLSGRVLSQSLPSSVLTGKPKILRRNSINVISGVERDGSKRTKDNRDFGEDKREGKEGKERAVAPDKLLAKLQILAEACDDADDNDDADDDNDECSLDTSVQ